MTHHREAELVGRPRQVVHTGEDHRRRHRQAVAGQQLVQVDLVGAADHRDRVVDDRHAFLRGAPGEAVGVVVDRGRLADEQRVELGQPRQVAPGDRLDLDAELLGDPRPVLDAGAARRRQRLVGIVEHGEGIARRRPVLLRAPLAGRMGVQRRYGRRRARSSTAWSPASAARRRICGRPLTVSTVTSSTGQRYQSNRSRPKRSKRGSSTAPKKTRMRVGTVLSSAAGERLGQRIVEFGQRLGVKLARAEVDHRLDRGDDPMAARLGEQRAIVAAALVGEGARQVDDLRPIAGEQAGPRQVIPGGDDLVRRIGVRKILRRIDENDPVGHG